jgi:short-subunit dehydrogenase
MSKARPFAVVTGASAGIGVAFARALAEGGYDLALVARRLDRLEKVAAELRAAHGCEAIPIRADLAELDAHLPIIDALAGRNVDALVNNAGYSLPKTYAATAWREQRDFVLTLVLSVAGLTHAVLPGMIARKQGRIIMVGSMAALSPGGAGHTLYPAAKSFVHKFALSLDAEVRAKGVRVTCVHPGFTETEFSVANNTKDLLGQAPRSFVTTADAVVRAALRANDNGRVIVIPGAHNALAAALMKYLPDGVVAPLLRGAAEKYRVAD